MPMSCCSLLRFGVVNGAAARLDVAVAIIVTVAPNAAILALDMRGIVVSITLSFRAEPFGVVAVAPGRAFLLRGIIIERISRGRPGPTGTKAEEEC